MHTHRWRKHALRLALISLLTTAAVGCKQKTSHLDSDAQDAEVQAEQSEKEETLQKADDELDAGGERALRLAIESDRRSEENKARDEYRNPSETLEFFGIKEDMVVLEIGPGAGWYSEILAPFLAGKGELIVGLPDPEGPSAKYRKGWEGLVKADESLYGSVRAIVFDPPTFKDLPEGTVDMVFSFRNVHGWVSDEVVDDAFEAVYTALKPGGVFGVIDHRADEDSDPAETAPQGYVPQDYVIERAEAAGFKLEEASEINANEKDTKDHPNGVWTLPPSLNTDDDEQKQKSLDIGESDRMTLRFVKPDDADADADAEEDSDDEDNEDSDE